MANKETKTSEATLFGKNVRREMKLQGISLDELCKRTKIAKSTLSLYLSENNVKPSWPGVEKALVIARSLGVSLDYLMGNSITREIKKDERITPTQLLKNLAQVINDTKLRIEFDPKQSMSFLISHNIHIFTFLSQLKNLTFNVTDKDRKDQLIDNITHAYKDLMVDNGELLDEYSYMVKNEYRYIYHDISEDDLRDFPDECYPVVDERKAEWQNALITKDFSYFKSDEFNKGESDNG